MKYNDIEYELSALLMFLVESEWTESQYTGCFIISVALSIWHVLLKSDLK